MQYVRMLVTTQLYFLVSEAVFSPGSAVFSRRLLSSVPLPVSQYPILVPILTPPLPTLTSTPLVLQDLCLVLSQLKTASCKAN